MDTNKHIRALLGLFWRPPEPGLLSFDEVERALRSRAQAYRGTSEIPVEAIVGSVGRYRDFTRAFLPLRAQARERLDSVRRAATLPPIDVYRVGEVYFVRDGNHRVALARSRGQQTIAAHVVEIPVRVSLTPDMDPEEVIGQACFSHFLEVTNLDRTRPDASVVLTCADRYTTLLEHIEVHRYYLGLEQQRDVSLEEAAASWHDQVYLPVVEALREIGTLREFPRRTEADLYLWVAYHRECLGERYGGQRPSDRQVAAALADRYSDRPVANLVKTVVRALRAAVQAVVESPEPPAA